MSAWALATHMKSGMGRVWQCYAPGLCSIDNMCTACQVRATTAKCLAATATHMTAEQWQLYFTKQLLATAGKLVSDATPEARGAAKGLIGTMRDAFTNSAQSSKYEVGGCNFSRKICSACHCNALYRLARLHKLLLEKRNAPSYTDIDSSKGADE